MKLHAIVATSIVASYLVACNGNFRSSQYANKSRSTPAEAPLGDQPTTAQDATTPKAASRDSVALPAPDDEFFAGLYLEDAMGNGIAADEDDIIVVSDEPAADDTDTATSTAEEEDTSAEPQPGTTLQTLRDFIANLTEERMTILIEMILMKADANKDNFISREEFLAVRFSSKDIPADKAAKIAERRGRIFDVLAGDDKKLDVREIRIFLNAVKKVVLRYRDKLDPVKNDADVSGRWQTILEKYDANHDGKLDQTEFEAMRKDRAQTSNDRREELKKRRMAWCDSIMSSDDEAVPPLVRMICKKILSGDQDANMMDPMLTPGN